jgi:hypothetical protein
MPIDALENHVNQVELLCNEIKFCKENFGGMNKFASAKRNLSMPIYAFRFCMHMILGPEILYNA